MHSASVNSEPGSNSPLKACGGRVGVRTRRLPLAPKMRIDSSQSLLVCPGPSDGTEAHTEYFPYALSPGGENRAPIRSQKPICQGTKNSSGLLAASQEAGGKFTLPLDRGFKRGLTGENIPHGPGCVNTYFSKIFFRDHAPAVSRRETDVRRKNYFYFRRAPRGAAHVNFFIFTRTRSFGRYRIVRTSPHFASQQGVPEK